MPLAEHGRAIAIRRKELGHRGNASPDERPSGTDRGGSVAASVQAGHQLPASRRTHRRDMKVGQANALRMQPIEVRRSEHRITVAGKVTISLIVTEYDDHIQLGTRVGGSLQVEGRD